MFAHHGQGLCVCALAVWCPSWPQLRKHYARLRRSCIYCRMTLIRFYSFGLMFEFDVLTVRGQTCGTQAFYDFELLLLQLTGPPYIFSSSWIGRHLVANSSNSFSIYPLFFGGCVLHRLHALSSSSGHQTRQIFSPFIYLLLFFSSLFVFSYLFWQERVLLGGKLMACFMIPDKGGDVRRNENDEREKQKGKRWRKVWVLVVRTRTFEGKGAKKLGWYGISWCPRRVLMMTIDRLLPTTHMTLILFSCVLNYS